MQIFFDPFSAKTSDTAVAIGNFDGFHRAHKALCDEMKVYAKTHGLSPAVLSFSPPAGVRTPLFSEQEKENALRKEEIDTLFLYRFDSLRALSCADFVQRILHDVAGAKAIFCGFNFRFGKDRTGDAETLQQLAEKQGMQTFVLPPIYEGDTLISSTEIRAALKQHDLARAEALLGHAVPASCRTLWENS